MMHFSLYVVTFKNGLKLLRCVRIGKNPHMYNWGSSDTYTYMSENTDMYLSYTDIHKVIQNKICKI